MLQRKKRGMLQSNSILLVIRIAMKKVKLYRNEKERKLGKIFFSAVLAFYILSQII